jgi:hypothetical protein
MISPQWSRYAARGSKGINKAHTQRVAELQILSRAGELQILRKAGELQILRKAGELQILKYFRLWSMWSRYAARGQSKSMHIH